MKAFYTLVLHKPLSHWTFPCLANWERLVDSCPRPGLMTSPAGTAFSKCLGFLDPVLQDLQQIHDSRKPAPESQEESAFPRAPPRHSACPSVTVRIPYLETSVLRVCLPAQAVPSSSV